ncbi:hypothetical protein AGMMS50229_13540 [Campylobacterota bacterium]|nr:hypothetical protein AGMMS50229_13540 [Campylobacterota bacterium]
MVKLILLFLWLSMIAVVALANVGFLISKVFHLSRKPPPVKPVVIPDFPIKEIESVIKDKNSTLAMLTAVAKAIIAHHPIDPKKDGKTSKEAKFLLDLIFTMAGHKNMSNEFQDEMYAGLIDSNPTYARDFDRARSKK